MTGQDFIDILTAVRDVTYRERTHDGSIRCCAWCKHYDGECIYQGDMPLADKHKGNGFCTLWNKGDGA